MFEQLIQKGGKGNTTCHLSFSEPIHVDKTITAELSFSKPIKSVPKVQVPVQFTSLIKPGTTSRNQRVTLQPVPIEDNVERSMLVDCNKCVSDYVTTMYKKEIQKKKVHSWLSRLVDQRGEDYIYKKLTADEVSKNAERIIDDIIGGKIDYNNYGKYLMHPIILETLISYCNNKLAIDKGLLCSALYTYEDYSHKENFELDSNREARLKQIDPALARNILQASIIIQQDVLAYELLYNKLINIRNTQNVSILMSVPKEFNEYKFSIRKRY